MRLAAPAEVLAAIVKLTDDGFCRRSDLIPLFPKLGERDLRRSIRRAVTLGLVLERRGPDGGLYLAASGEGWDLLRSEGRRTKPAAK
ncbi:MAG: hypothetical protein JWM24_406 [Solirubrobacterales bacterium]|nr:hypothetical protein [Solirubrobacterales bacterium]